MECNTSASSATLLRWTSVASNFFRSMRGVAWRGTRLNESKGSIPNRVRIFLHIQKKCGLLEHILTCQSTAPLLLHPNLIFDINRGGGNVVNPNMDRGKPPLRWMYREAQSAGLRLKDTDLKLEWATLGVINESLTWVWQLFECFPIKQLSYKDAESTTISCVIFHSHNSQSFVFEHGLLASI